MLVGHEGIDDEAVIAQSVLPRHVDKQGESGESEANKECDDRKDQVEVAFGFRFIFSGYLDR